MSSDLVHRVFQHKIKFYSGFTSTYNCNLLVYYEDFPNVSDALHREKQLKKYRREWKKNLINSFNPEWRDLSEGWYDPREFEAFKKLI